MEHATNDPEVGMYVPFSLAVSAVVGVHVSEAYVRHGSTRALESWRRASMWSVWDAHISSSGQAYRLASLTLRHPNSELPVISPQEDLCT